MLLLEQKKQIVSRIQKEITSHKIVALVDLQGLPAKQLQNMRKQLKSKGFIFKTKKTLLKRAFEKQTPELKELISIRALQPALLFSDTNPFELYQELKQNKSPAPAFDGAISPKDIIIPAGPTDILPGPAIGELQRVGLETKVESGKLVITKNKKIIIEGETITQDHVNVLNKLGIEPLEIGLDLVAAHENGTIFTRSVLDVDIDEIRSKFETAAGNAWNLAVNAAIPTPETLPIIIANAVRNAKSLAVEAEIYDPEVMDEIIAKAERNAQSLNAQIDVKEPPATKKEKTDAEETKPDGEEGIIDKQENKPGGG